MDSHIFPPPLHMCTMGIMKKSTDPAQFWRPFPHIFCTHMHKLIIDWYITTLPLHSCTITRGRISIPSWVWLSFLYTHEQSPEKGSLSPAEKGSLSLAVYMYGIPSHCPSPTHMHDHYVQWGSWVEYELPSRPSPTQCTITTARISIRSWVWITISLSFPYTHARSLQWGTPSAVEYGLPSRPSPTHMHNHYSEDLHPQNFEYGLPSRYPFPTHAQSVVRGSSFPTEYGLPSRHPSPTHIHNHQKEDLYPQLSMDYHIAILPLHTCTITSVRISISSWVWIIISLPFPYTHSQSPEQGSPFPAEYGLPLRHPSPTRMHNHQKYDFYLPLSVEYLLAILPL